MVKADENLSMTPQDPIPEHLEREHLDKANDLLNAIANASDEHLTYDQMEAWVEDTMDQTAREFVVAHTGICAFCKKQLTAYESYAPVMSAPTAAPARLVPFWERFRSGLQSISASMPAAPKLAMAALAVAVLALAPTVIHNARSTSTTWEQIESLPASVRQAAREVVTAATPIRPQALADLAPNADSQLVYPVSEVVEETQPDLQWRALGPPCSIAVVDSANKVLAQAFVVDKTEWIVPVALNRGAVYAWEVHAMDSNGAPHRASFRVLGESEDQTLAQLRASGAGHLALGAVYQQFGMLTAAQHEFEKLAAAAPGTPGSEDAAKLLDHIRLLRGR